MESPRTTKGNLKTRGTTTKHIRMRFFCIFFVYLMLLGKTGLAQNNADCKTAIDVCKKKLYKIDRTGGQGNDDDGADLVPCFMNGDNFGQAEENSTWFKFEIAESGILAFTITPARSSNDIDFVVYKLPPSGDCRNKTIVRCMAAGDSYLLASTSACMGKTGLRDNEYDSSEDAGCGDVNDNAWLAPLRVVKGEKYALLVSNVSEAGPGFTIEFYGSCKLPCDDKKTKEKPQKPQKDDTPTPVTPPPVTPSKFPDTIGGRMVEIGEEVKVKNKTIRVKIWDSQVEDGDVVSVYLGDKKVLDRIYLKLKPREFELKLPAGKEHLLTLYADDFGKSEPNTAKLSINDGVQEQTIDLVAGRKKQGSVRIVME
jgi:hypothetical protein